MVYTCTVCTADGKYVPYTLAGLINHRRIAHLPWLIIEEEPG